MNDFQTSSSCSRETRKIRKILNEEVKYGIQPSSESETEFVSSRKELHPIGYYINDREDMIEQMFSIIKGDKLRKMLPPILKDMPLDELKADCLLHLLGMSKKRIFATLEGKEIDSSSDSESNSDGPTPRKRTKNIVKPIIIKQEGCSDISDNSEEVILIDPDLELKPQSSVKKTSVQGQTRNVKSKKDSRKHQLKNKNVPNEHKTIRRSKELKTQESDNSADDNESDSHNIVDSEEKIPTEGKTLLEILELEMRARAIRALLHKSESTVVKQNVSQPSNLECLTVDNPVEKEAVEQKKEKSVKKIRKKKSKNDDVIVISPKLITIDLTEENATFTIKNKTKEPILGNKKVTKTANNTLRTFKSSEVSNTEPISLCFETLGKKQNITLEEEKGDTNISETCLTTESLGKGSDKNVLDVCAGETNTSETCLTKESLKTGSDNIALEITAGEKSKQQSNWAQRWLDSKDVKKVVSTSKIYGKIRKKIKNAKLAKLNQESNQEIKDKTNEIQGSVNEYELLNKYLKTPSSSNLTVSDTKVNDVESGEQVPDVTSTKPECPKDKDAQENASSDNNIIDDNSTPILKQVTAISIDQINSETKEMDTLSTTPTTVHTDVNQKADSNCAELNSSNKDCTENKLNNLDIDNIDKKSVLDKENKPQFENVHNDKIVDIEKNDDQPLISDANVEPCDATDCDFNSKLDTSKDKQQAVIENEALEINLTEEDRDIDGMHVDEK